jgi:hypothetical protein
MAGPMRGNYSATFTLLSYPGAVQSLLGGQLCHEAPMNLGLPSLDKMSCDAALSVFHQEGEYPSQATLRQSWLRLLKKYHEVGTTPNPERLTLINAARDVLRTCGDDALPIAHTSEARLMFCGHGEGDIW